MRIREIIIEQLILLKSFVEISLPLWLRCHVRPNQIAASRINRFLILASDPSDPSGSMGELAMLTGLIQGLRLEHPNAIFTIIGTRQHTIEIPFVGPIEVISAWEGWHGSVAFDHLLRQHCAIFVLGADVLDGRYGTSLVYRMASYCNHAATIGTPATITGFSFNSTPKRLAVRALSKLHRHVRVNIRDPASLRRFESKVNIPAMICSDVAFLMESSTSPNFAIETWINTARESGLTPVGLNINTHAFSKIISEIGTHELINKIAIQLIKAGQHSNIAYILIPHDTKSKSGDVTLLRELEGAIKALGYTHLATFASANPTSIKRLSGMLDLVITARMHLAIAALGSGTPILSISYQEKFEGLHEHFDLSKSYILTPSQCTSEDFSRLIIETIIKRESLSIKIKNNLHAIKSMAKHNLILN